MPGAPRPLIGQSVQSSSSIVLRFVNQFDNSVYLMEKTPLYTSSPGILTLDIQMQATPGWHPFLIRASVF
jgi:hypothetical protein